MCLLLFVLVADVKPLTNSTRDSDELDLISICCVANVAATVGFQLDLHLKKVKIPLRKYLEQMHIVTDRNFIKDQSETRQIK